MNMQPIIQQLSDEDFNKMLAGCNNRERFYLRLSRADQGFEYHIDLPGPDGVTEPENMATWLANEERFSSDPKQQMQLAQKFMRENEGVLRDLAK
jgi:hypothetical protein